MTIFQIFSTKFTFLHDLFLVSKTHMSFPVLNNPAKKSCFSWYILFVDIYILFLNLQFTTGTDYSIDYSLDVQKKNLLILDQRIDISQMFLSGIFFKYTAKWDIINRKFGRRKAISSDSMRIFNWLNNNYLKCEMIYRCE